MVGRGFRLSPATGKTECLVLDYGRNIERFGPIDCIKVTGERSNAKGEPLVKTCPRCRKLVHLSVMLCSDCGYEFPRKSEERKAHEAHAANAAILSGEVVVDTIPVSYAEYQVWEKRGAPPDAPKTVRVTYYSDILHTISEWLCPEHGGYARSKFERWWREHAHPDAPMPNKAEDVIEYNFMGMLRDVNSLTVRRVSGEKYPEIVGYELGGCRVDTLEDVQTEDYDDLPF